MKVILNRLGKNPSAVSSPFDGKKKKLAGPAQRVGRRCSKRFAGILFSRPRGQIFREIMHSIRLVKAPMQRILPN